ncbi:HNH endonuclease signature motif containing protein [Paenarthrobacter aurescens]|jgi:hypothetical protein|uniref:HNH endonuclease signature motif containing protein n=1 Tax=Paenarthrobacter aurescens TaxID=43663 RepID=UPI0009FE9407
MIEIQKQEMPAWIVRNQSEKTAEYIAAPPAKKPSPWRAPEVVDSLKRECAKKCIYCESIIDDVSYSAVEHIRPKSLFEDLVLAWDNLGLACPRCNTNKGDYWTEDPGLRLLDPYRDVISEHLEFRGPLTVAKLGSSRGENTLRRLKLHSREDLLISRLRRIEELHTRLAMWHQEHDSGRKELYAEDVAAAIAPDREFSALLRAYAVQMGFPAARCSLGS